VITAIGLTTIPVGPTITTLQGRISSHIERLREIGTRTKKDDGGVGEFASERSLKGREDEAGQYRSGGILSLNPFREWRTIMATIKNQHDRIARDLKMAAGITKHFQKKASFTLSGEKYTSEELLSLLQARTDAARTAQTARAAWLNAAAALQEQLAKTDPVFANLQQQLLSTYSPTANELADFGIAPRKRPVLTAEQRLAAVQKRRATRNARHTLGKKQRLDVTSEVTNVTSPATRAAASTHGATP
jgi:hypothetical protein